LVRPSGGRGLFARYPARQSYAANGDRARLGRSHYQIANASRRKNQTSRSRCLEQRRSNCARGPGCESDRTLAPGKMDEKLTDETAESVEAGVSPADSETATSARSAADTAASTRAAPRELSINELEKLDDLFPIARDFNLHLHSARSRHHHILDIARAALGQGANVTAEGFLDQVADSFGLLRYPELNFLPVREDVYAPRPAIEFYHLRPGQKLAGKLRPPRDREKGLVLEDVITIEEEPAEKWSEPTDFEKLTPQFPQGRIMLENPKTNSICARGVDLLAPLGHGQRGLIVAPPRVGKTILLKEIAKAIRVNHPEIVLILLLVDERPEEVTDLEREIDCQIYHSNFDENVIRHV